jgi:hypothetical protein
MSASLLQAGQIPGDVRKGRLFKESYEKEFGKKKIKTQK